MKKLKFLITWLLSAYMLCFPITNCSAETNQVIYGDANCDTTVDICDVVALKQHLVGLEELSEQGKENCDFFCNTEITVQSLLNMNNYIIKTADSLEPLTYYQLTDEEVQEYIKKYSLNQWKNNDDFYALYFYKNTQITKKELNEELKNAGIPSGFIKTDNLLNSIFIYVDDTSAENLAKIILCLKKNCPNIKFGGVETYEY